MHSACISLGAGEFVRLADDPTEGNRAPLCGQEEHPKLCLPHGAFGVNTDTSYLLILHQYLEVLSATLCLVSYMALI